jgi:Zn-dependent protease
MLLQLLGQPIGPTIIMVLLFGALILISIAVHEFAHAFVANKCGDPTAKLEGRVTLNPFAHLDPIGTTMILLTGFGWGKPVPVNPRYYNHRRDDIFVSLAGIIANLILAFLLSSLLRLGLVHNEFLQDIFDIMIRLNIALAAFNLLPIPPLDGSHIVEYFLNDENLSENYRRYGIFVLIALVVLDFNNTSILTSIMRPITAIFSFIARGTFEPIF